MVLTDKQEAEIQGIFEAFDINNNGTISLSELGTALRATGIEIS